MRERPQISICVPSSTTRSGGISEVGGGRERAGGEQHEQALLDHVHDRVRRGDQRLAGEEEGGQHQVDRDAVAPAQLERPRDVGRVGEAVADEDAEEALAQLLDLDPLGVGDVGHLLVAHGHEQHALVQHLVVLDVVQHRLRHDLDVAGHEHGRALHAGQLRVELVDEAADGERVAVELVPQDVAAVAPGDDAEREQAGDQQREPAARGDLERVGGEVGEVDQQQRAERGERGRTPAPQPAGHDGGQDGVDAHGAGDRDAVGRGEVAGGAEAQHQGEDAHHQQPVDPRDVDLPDLGRRGVADRHARQVAELDRLPGEREHARDHRLRGDDGGERGEHDQREQPPVRRQVVEGLLDRQRLVQDQRALAEIVEDEPGQDEGEPGDADRQAAEVAHVGVERLGSRHRQHDGAQRHEGLRARDLEEAERAERVERLEHARVLDDLVEAEHAQDREPGQHDRPEQLADHRRPPALDQEQRHQHHGGERHDVGREGGRGGLQPLDRREHRDRGGDQPVAVEQRQAGDREPDDRLAQGAALGSRPRRQRAERQHAALAPVVRAHDQQHVLHRDDQDQRPEDERERAQHGGLALVQPAGLAERLLDRVERARPDVAVDHAQGRQRQAADRAARVARTRLGLTEG